MQGGKAVGARDLAAVALMVGGAAAVAWLLRFSADDAYISYRYVENFLDGHGIVWQPGDRVEGYTNLLWILLLSAIGALGGDIVSGSQILGIALASAAMVAAFALARPWLPDPGARLRMLLLLGTNFTFLAFATGGLEGGLLSLLSTSALLLAMRVLDTPPAGRVPLHRYGTISLLFCLAILTHPLTGLFAVIFSLALFARAIRERPGAADLGAATLAYLAPVVLIFVPLLAWKLWFYGQILPNTFYLKGTTLAPATIEQGLRYIYYAFRAYPVLPFLIVAYCVLVTRERRHGVRVFFLAALAYIFYLVSIAGDHIEFRFLMPVLPVLMMLTVAGIDALGAFRGVLVGTLVAMSALHGAFYPATFHIQSVAELKDFASGKRHNWIAIGTRLGEVFPQREDGPRIALTPAGIIPFHARLPALDMHGINDATVAREGLLRSYFPGHMRIAHFDYLEARGTNLLIGHPLMIDRSYWDAGTVSPLLIEQELRMAGRRIAGLPATTQVLFLDVDGERGLVMLYLEHHGAVDAAIARGLLEARDLGSLW